ncbi:hypothetical protein A9Q99_12350 [Gammaproteobacteria bacterium 45_16_T64]|nr:hypothetical protein A9Q99_12350 [Gammaproteobacteria bacterium 45_16_T64]
MKQLGRLFAILHIFAKYRLDELLPAHAAALPVRILLRLIPSSWFASTKEDPWVRLRLALEELGPVYIKFGQLLSTRKDLLDEKAIEELSKLQDNVPPFDEQASLSIIEKELKASVTTLFAEFNITPMASASIAQVHAAKLHSGQEVVVKVVRPNIERTVKLDVSLMQAGAARIERAMPDLQRFHLLQIVKDYEHIILGELDMMREAANTNQFRRNFADSPLLYVPEVHWDYCSSNVMVMERVYGVPISDVEAIKAAGINLETMAEIGVEIFFTQVFRDNFFHADMHPGNVMVSLKNPEQPQYISIDNAIVGSLNRDERYLLARQLMALLDKDYEQIALLLVDAGWVPKTIRVKELENALRGILEPILERPLSDIEFGPILISLFQTARRFEMQALPQFLLLEKTLIHVEGLGQQLYPELDIWTVGRPLLENWIRDQMGPDAILTAIKRNTPALLEQLPQLPKMAWEALDEIRQLGDNQERFLAQLETRHLQQMKKDRIIILAGSGALLLGVVWSIRPDLVPDLSAIPWPAWTFGLGGAFILWAKGLRARK